MQAHGELLLRVDPQFGLLHRGTEKLCEARTARQALPYFDRFDYVANLFQEHAFCLTLEALPVAQQHCKAHVSIARVLFDELSRALNHLLTLSATALDLSAMGPVFWAFEERERIMELFERVSGARMHTALYSPFSFAFATLTRRFWLDLVSFLGRVGRALAGSFLGLLNNRALKTRLGGVGQLSQAKLRSYGITGVIARGAGMLVDLRVQPRRSYSAYRALSFRSFLGRRGDNLDRFLLRIKEVLEVFRVIAQVTTALNNTGMAGAPAPWLSSARMQTISAWRIGRAYYFFLYRRQSLPCLMVVGVRLCSRQAPSRASLATGGAYLGSRGERQSHGLFTGMDEVIGHFRTFSEGQLLAAGASYRGVEGPKGEFGVFIVTDGTTRPYRVKVRTPVSHNLHLIPSLGAGFFFADFVASFCSLDVVFGEIDR
jgi:NADH-quinone oxidoreductase subunit D